MNRKKALETLGLTETESHNPDLLKRQYRAKILQYHPDKNRSPDAADRFREAQDAYRVLSDEPHEDAKSYNDIMSAFLSAFFEKDGAHDSVPFISKISAAVFSRILRLFSFKPPHSGTGADYLCRINRPLLVILHRILLNYGSAFHLPEGVLETIEEALNRDSHEYIVLNPTLEDLLSEENVYKLKYEDKTFLVPLWHHDLTFDCLGRELMVKCYPVLPENMELDECNVLTVQLEYTVAEVWNREVEVCIGNRTYRFDGRELKMTEEVQTIVLSGGGIPYNNTLDVLDCGTLQNIVLEIWVAI